MFRSFYAVTKDRKGGIHQYRLNTGEGVPRGEEIVNLKVAGQFNIDEFLSTRDVEKMYAVAAQMKVRQKRATKE